MEAVRTSEEEEIWGRSINCLEVLFRNNTTLGSLKDFLNNNMTNLNTISVIKSKRMRWTGHIARLREVRNSYKIFFAKTRSDLTICNIQG
jgi:hypothetical protein